MARARNIKPGFFKNEDLGTADPFVSLLFAGLWTLADKAGILEDRPLRIKAELFPYRDGFDINGYLTVLEQFKLIHRYEVDGTKYIIVVNFKKHQTPHHTEKESEYPAYSDSYKKPVTAPLNNRATPSDSLIPDSLIPDSLIPDSLNPDSPNPPNPKKPRADASRGSRLPADWLLPKSWGEWAIEERRDLTAEDIRKISAAFKDHWISQPSRHGVKADWEATWRNWIRKERPTKVMSFADRKAREKADSQAALDAWARGEQQGPKSTFIEGEFGRA